MPEQNRLYSSLAWLWPYVSDPADYAAEAAHWNEVLRQKLGPGKHALLELGVGGGHNLSHFAAGYAVTALDLSPSMLRQARTHVPEARLIAADMRAIPVSRAFDAVLAHDAIMYLRTLEELRCVFEEVARCLAPGGLFLLAPDHYAEYFKNPTVRHATRTRNGVTVTCVEYEHDPNPGDTQIDHHLTYYILRRGELQVEYDLHHPGLFPFDAWVETLSEAGFDVEGYPYLTLEDGTEIPLLAATLAR